MKAGRFAAALAAAAAVSVAGCGEDDGTTPTDRSIDAVTTGVDPGTTSEQESLTLRTDTDEDEN